MSNLENLRAQALANQKRVARKLRRQIKQHHIKEKYVPAPQTSREHVRKLNTRQLEKLIERQENFMSRKNQWWGDRKGRPLPLKEVRDYLNVVRGWNKVKAEDFKTWGNLSAYIDPDRNIPNWRLQDEWKRTRKHNLMGNDPIAWSYPKVHGFENAEALVERTNKLRKRLEPGYMAKYEKAVEENAREMLVKRGDFGNLAESFDNMSAKARRKLLHDGGFWTALKMMYEMLKYDVQTVDWARSIFSDQYYDIRERMNFYDKQFRSKTYQSPPEKLVFNV